MANLNQVLQLGKHDKHGFFYKLVHYLCLDISYLNNKLDKKKKENERMENCKRYKVHNWRKPTREAIKL